MSFLRDPNRPVIWTKVGKLIYADVQERDYILWHLSLTFKRLINHQSVDAFTNDELAHACNAWILRKDELNSEQNKGSK